MVYLLYNKKLTDNLEVRYEKIEYSDPNLKSRVIFYLQMLPVKKCYVFFYSLEKDITNEIDKLINFFDSFDSFDIANLPQLLLDNNLITKNDFNRLTDILNI